MISDFDEVKKKINEFSNETGSMTFAEVIGLADKPASLVQPTKKAMKQIKVDDSRVKNVVIYGIDIDIDEEAVKKQAAAMRLNRPPLGSMSCLSWNRSRSWES